MKLFTETLLVVAALLFWIVVLPIAGLVTTGVAVSANGKALMTTHRSMRTLHCSISV